MAKIVTLKTDIVGRKDLKVYLPNNFKKQEKWPLIISLHGYGGSSALQNFYVRLNHFKNKYGYVFTAPNGLINSEGKAFWNASNFCCDFEKTNTDEVEYINSIIEEIKNSSMIGRIDPDKIFLVGYSNGAFLASKLACSSKIKVSGLVTLSGTGDINTGLNCEHARAIPVLHIHGTDDETIPYNGTSGHIGALEHLDLWAMQNGCHGSLINSNSRINFSNFKIGRETDHFSYTDCLAPVEHYRINGGGHFGIYKKKLTRRILNFLFIN